MALFEREETDFGSDVGTRALSVIAVENHFVERVYEKLASVYDLIFGPTLHPGRLVARDRMEIRPGSHILEVGVGTGINASLRAGDVTRDELVSLAEQVATTHRAECLRVAREADGRAANPFESVLRAVSLDVPGLRLEPQQVVVTRPRIIRPDLLDWRRRVVVEAESFEFHGDRSALVRDCERYNELGALGWTVYRFTWGHVMHAPWYVKQVLAAAAARSPGRAA